MAFDGLAFTLSQTCDNCQLFPRLWTIQFKASARRRIVRRAVFKSTLSGGHRVADRPGEIAAQVARAEQMLQTPARVSKVNRHLHVVGVIAEDREHVECERH